MSVDGIYTVLKADFSKSGVGKGEAHDFPEISFISRGKHYGILDGKESERVQGDLIIIAPGSFHKSARPSDSEALIISFASSSSALKDLYNRNLTLSPSQEKAFRAIVEEGLGLFCYRAPDSEMRGMILKEDADETSLYKMKKELIRDGKMNFTEISESLGFNSLHYFSRLFKKITGLSPTACCRALKKDLF